ncbi:MAG: HNH endonuclease [Candidatus Binataceae bacterium]
MAKSASFGQTQRRTPSRLTLDHWLPKCRGGTNKPTNLMTCCLDCNLKKGRHRITWRPPLRREE